MRLTFIASAALAFLAANAAAAPVSDSGADLCLAICQESWNHFKVDCAANHDKDKSECTKNQCLFDKICRQQCHLVYGGEYIAPEEYTNTCSKFSDISSIQHNTGVKRSQTKNLYDPQYYHGRPHEGARFRGYNSAKQSLKKSENNPEPPAPVPTFYHGRLHEGARFEGYASEQAHIKQSLKKSGADSQNAPAPSPIEVFYHGRNHEGARFEGYEADKKAKLKHLKALQKSQHSYDNTYKKDTTYYEDTTYYPPCEDSYGGYEYGDDGYRYGYEHGRSCLVSEDYEKVYGTKHSKYEDEYDDNDYKPSYHSELRKPATKQFLPLEMKISEIKAARVREAKLRYAQHSYDDREPEYYDDESKEYENDYFPPCENKYGGYEYGGDGYRYGFEHGRSCLVQEDYDKVYGKDNEKDSYIPEEGPKKPKVGEDAPKDGPKKPEIEIPEEDEVTFFPHSNNSEANCPVQLKEIFGKLTKCHADFPSSKDDAMKCLCSVDFVAFVEVFEKDCGVHPGLNEKNLAAVKALCKSESS